ncbi:MAG: ImmA/IrrE family metallo-endopeptidase [Clostridiaceae bacterium]|nr:ImmA/IrrE family metallo-endopeptidase [Clostridiaceae bacterium]
MKKEDITKAALSLRKKYGVVSGKELCALLEVDIIEMHPGTDENAFNAFVFKSNRRNCVVLNMDLTPGNRNLVLYHESGHVVLDHASTGIVACQELFSVREKSVMEIEANEFAVEYFLDNNEVLATLKETNSFFDTARILRVTPAMLVYKWRMMAYYGLLNGEPPIQASSDCMGHLDNDGIDDDDYGW